MIYCNFDHLFVVMNILMIAIFAVVATSKVSHVKPYCTVSTLYEFLFKVMIINQYKHFHFSNEINTRLRA